jgi:Flp pilus assembly protein TadG
MTVADRERGTALVEFALLSTFVLMTIFGILEAARALYTYHLVSYDARLGSRYAIVRGSTCNVMLPSCTPATEDDIQAYVRSLSPAVDPNALTVTAAWQETPVCTVGAPQGTGCVVTVTVSYRFQPVVPLLSLTTIPITSSSVMVISQ